MRALTVVAGLCFGLCMASLAPAADEMGRRTRKIHGPIPTNGASLEQARRAILLGMYHNKGVKLTYEGETANSVFARWDYRGGAVVFEVRYDDKQIQVLYRDASRFEWPSWMRAARCHVESCGQ